MFAPARVFALGNKQESIDNETHTRSLPRLPSDRRIHRAAASCRGLRRQNIWRQGDGKTVDATAINKAIDPPEREKAYPDSGMFGTMPAYGFFCSPCERTPDGRRRHELREG